jgi:ubiquinone/menaquinone biosynthesis C-methylase UbiE
MTNPVAALFDMVAPDYDQSGVAFFGPIAERLVEALDPRPGERCLDVGCGRGAVTRRLAEAVGPTGEVQGIDLSSEMVRLATDELAGLPQASAAVGDALAPPGDGWDLLASGLVLFFLPDPVSALRVWHDRLRPGGRVGVTTFGATDETWTAVDEVLKPYLTAQDPRSAEAMARFGTDEGVETMLRDAGFTDVATSRAPLPVLFADTDQWYAFSLSTGQRRAWAALPEDQRPAVRARCAELLGAARRTDGVIEVRQDVRVTTGRRPG